MARLSWRTSRAWKKGSNYETGSCNFLQVHAIACEKIRSLMRVFCNTCLRALTPKPFLGERQSIAQKGVRAIDTRNSQLENGSNAAKTSVRAPGLSTDEREHPFV